MKKVVNGKLYDTEKNISGENMKKILMILCKQFFLPFDKSPIVCNVANYLYSWID